MHQTPTRAHPGGKAPTGTEVPAVDAGDGPPAVTARGLVREFRRGTEVVRALDGVDLMLWHRQFVAVVGPSGSGKSTLLHLLAGLDQPDAGEVTVDGTPIAGLADDQLTDLRRERIGLVFQFFHLMPSLSAWENVALPVVLSGRPIRAGRERAMELLNHVGLDDRADHRPAELSGGQLQRVAVARAFMNEPQVLLADEPTGSLDSHSGALVIDLLAELCQTLGSAVIVVSHDYRVGAAADQIIRLEDGRVACPGAAV